MKLKSIITISGRICSGKSYTATLLKNKFGFPVASFGGYLKYYCDQNNLPSDRKTLQEVGDTFIKEKPQKFLMDVINHFTGKSDSIILEGVRHKVILDAIPQLAENSVTIFLDADVQTRAKRCYQRNKESDDFETYEKFIASDNHRVEEEIESLKLNCDVIIDSTRENKQELFNLISTYLRIK